VRAFLICDVTVKDRERLGEYLRLSQHTLEPYGGVFHVQAGAVEVIEGDWDPSVVVVVEFPSMEQAKQWYESADYAPALRVKPDALERNMIVVEALS
jgi:uncharacterized protein (DUF1330 family)